MSAPLTVAALIVATADAAAQDAMKRRQRVLDDLLADLDGGLGR